MLFELRPEEAKMKFFSTMILLSMVVLVLLAAMVLAIANPAQVSLDLGYWDVSLTLGQVLVLSFALGMSLGLLALLYAMFSSEVTIKILESKLTKIKTELESLRTNGVNERI